MPSELLEALTNLSNIRWVTAIPAAVVIFVLCTLLYRLTLHPLAGFPGPFEARLSGSWRNRRYLKGSWHDDILQVHEKYGAIVRISPDELSIVDEHATKQLYGHGSKALKTEWYGTWDSKEFPNLFSTRSKAEHSFMRRRVSPAYSMSAMLRYEQYIQPCLDLMMDGFRKHADQGHPVVMSNWLDWLAFDVVGTLAYGQSFGQLETESDKLGLGKMIHEGFYVLSNVGHWIGQSRILQSPAFGKVLTMMGVPNPFDTFNNWTKTIIQERRQNAGKHERYDMLQHFMEMKSTTGGPATDVDVLGEAVNIIGAGADTTSIAMGTCLYYIVRHPDVYQKVQKEIDEYYEQNSLQRAITYQQTQELPYFTAAAREAMRLIPSITYQLPRVMPEEMVVAGRSIPAGTHVGVSPIAANRNKSVWGLDANEFKPSRWLESEEKTRYLNANDMTFGGHGARMCIGRNLALVEVHKFLGQFLRDFDVAFEDPEKPWRLHSQWFAVQSDMRMKITARRDKTA
ncbi:related to pisatin demethylase [Ramularia collo-cygni]|uniref:Related to pisatin demethylase n=1 Tax=Ramularia collo-cygni TaxID=112498 RepID=A0A2D3UPS6_9PEZI|nr:related to pisatin demethylase [Ramularia collo-cygni]CZT17471.1 related to pisatin demethylase [Ramularia collo-cygni]